MAQQVHAARFEGSDLTAKVFPDGANSLHVSACSAEWGVMLNTWQPYRYGGLQLAISCAGHPPGSDDDPWV
jgi:hypothetical protein